MATLPAFDRFSATFGGTRGRVAYDHHRLADALELLNGGDLAGACRLTRTHRLGHYSLLSRLAPALAQRALEDRWGDCVRRLLDWTGALSLSTATVAKSTNHTGAYLLHLWPDGRHHHWPHHVPGDSRAVCGVSAEFLSRAPRGAWTNPSVCGANHPERWRRCEDCAPHASEFPDTLTGLADPVFGREAFRPVVAALAETLLSELQRDPANAKLSAISRHTQHFDGEELIRRAVARSSVDGGLTTWKLALHVMPKVWAYGLCESSARDYLPGIEDPSALLNEDDWMLALGDIELRHARGRRSPKQTGDFRRTLWRRTLQASRGLPADDPTRLDGYSVVFTAGR